MPHDTTAPTLGRTVTSRFIGVDWGTTNCRAYLIEDGIVVDAKRDAPGMLSVPAGDFAAAAERLRSDLGDAPMLLAGMIGSNRGWVDAGYVPCPATIADVAAAIVTVADGVAIVPGVKVVDGLRADVMRGEEVQLLGAVAQGLAPPDALLCQPGTHCKWATMRGGALIDFATAMTGELFALLKNHALIGAAMTGTVANGAAFRAGVTRAADGDLLAGMFGVRPASLLGLRDDRDAASYVSGLLIGSDCRAQVGSGEIVHLLADAPLGDLYATAIDAAGGSALRVDSEAAFVAGITRLWESSQ